MKKFLRFFLVLILVVAAGIIILGLVEPNDVTITRTVMIKAPKDVVFGQMVNFKNWPNWSPWYKIEPTMKITYSGTDGQVGSAYHWVGSDKKTGEGEMKNMGVNGTRLDFQVDFVKPFKGSAKGYLSADDTAGTTKATWSFVSHMAFPMNAMQVFMNMDKMLGKDFEDGLNNLKKYAEDPVNGATITAVDYPGHIFAGVRSTIFWDGMKQFFMDTYPMLGKELGPKITGPASGLYYTWDTVNKRADMAAAFIVTDTSAPIKGVSYMTVAPSKAYMAVHKGGYSSIGKEHMALMKYMTDNVKWQTLVIEEYVVGQNQNPDSNAWVTNIYYLVK